MYSTKGYPLLCSGEDVLATNAVLKITFGNHYYYIVRAKGVMQTLDNIAKQIRTGLNKGGYDESHVLHHVVKRIKSTRYLEGRVTVLFKGLTPLNLIKTEQMELDKVDGDVYCLNNNYQAYVPIGTQLLTEKEKQSFLNWYEKTRK